MPVLGELREAIERVAGEVGPALVGVGQRWGIGSGVVISAGKVLTNAHNVRGDEVAVTFSDGRSATATVAGIDIDGDVAVLSVDTRDARAIAWAAADSPAIGTPVLALANPGGRGLRVTVGLVSGTERSFRGPRGRRISGSVEHTAPLLPGSSGGPIVDENGALLGLNTNRLGEGFYLAIPADQALRDRVESLSRGERVTRPRLGVAIAPAQVAQQLRRAVGLADVPGLLVRAVEEDGPAAEAGIREGDLITSAGDTRLDDADELHAVLDALRPGTALTLTLLRGTEERQVTITL